MDERRDPTPPEDPFAELLESVSYERPGRPPTHWRDAPGTLLALAAGDLDAGGVPMPMLLAYTGDEPGAVITLRPFAPGEMLQAFVEVLSLLLPLGVDRLACALPVAGGSGTSDVTDELQRRRLLLATADGRSGPTRTCHAVFPGEYVEGLGWRWRTPVDPPPSHEGSLVAALTVLLDARHDLGAEDDDGLQLAAQFGRILLLGHEVAVAPSLALRLERASAT